MKASFILVCAMLVISGACARDLQQQFSSGASCTASANSQTAKTAKDGFKIAVASAFKAACSAKSPQALVESDISIFKTCAFAIVRVWTEAFASCTTYGKNSWGCAASSAYARGQSKAYIGLVSLAVAEADNTCAKCSASTFASAFADLLVKLFAKAEAVSKASVCIGPNETAYAYAWSACNSEVIAHGLAYAFAEAAIKGRCTNLDADALAVVSNYVKVDPYCDCQGYAQVCTGDRPSDCVWTRNAKYNSAALAKNYPILYPNIWAYFDAKCKAKATQIV